MGSGTSFAQADEQPAIAETPSLRRVAVDLFAVGLAGLVVPIMISQWVPGWVPPVWGVLYVLSMCLVLFAPHLSASPSGEQRLGVGATMAVAGLWACIPWIVPGDEFANAAAALALMTVVVVAADSIYLPFVMASTWLAPTLALALSLGLALAVRGFPGLAVTVAIFSLYMILGGRRISGLFEELRAAERSERAARSRYELLSSTDPLTGFLNRRGAMKSLARIDGPVTMALFDIDGFKKVNDHYDHGVGDQTIQSVLKSMEVDLGPSWTVARWAGDELLAFSSEPDARTDQFDPSRIMCACDFRGRPVVLAISVSGGVAQGDLQTRSISEVLSDADLGLARAKRHGKGRIEYVSSAADVGLESALR